MSSATAIDIRGPITEICERLGLNHKNVAQLQVTPDSVTATVYQVDDQGNKYFDREAGVVPIETLEFDVTT